MLSFFQNTLLAMGLSVADNIVDSSGKYLEQDGTKVYPQFFTEDVETGNVLIHYHALQGNVLTYRKDGNKWAIPLVRTRLREPYTHRESKQLVKYLSPSGAGTQPFFYKTIIEAFKSSKPIPTLVITEGEKKAVALCLAGVPCVGIPSIHGFYEGDQKGKLNEYLLQLIVACKVEKLIFLTDADTLVVTYEATKDLAKRQQSFYAAVKYFRESLQFLIDANKDSINVYFAHINTKFKDEGKGIDDLLLAKPKEKAEIVEDLLKYQFASRYFSCKIITDGKVNKVYSYFGLKDENEFYALYKEYIGNREFTFKGRRYEWDGEAVRYVRHEDTDKYLRIGADWMKLIKVPNKHNELEEELIPYKITEISRDYKKYPDFIDNIPKFDSFCNVPCWNADYKRVLNNNYNLCNPLQYVPQEGNCANTLKFLKHIFGGNGTLGVDGVEQAHIGDPFTVAMDWLTIIFRHPTQMLPVPILVSKENKTGKSTYLKWLQAIYGSNMAILGNDQFKMKFNAHYITKFIISIDEGFLDVDKKAEKERLKQLATADTAYLENKGMNIKKFPYFGKLIICSNDADSIMKMEEEETRWFVVKVPRIKDEDEDPFLEKKLRDEIPAFLNLLAHRAIHHPNASRLWFKPEWFITDQFKAVVENTRTMLEKELAEMIKELFYTYRITHMGLPLEFVCAKLNSTLKYKVNKTDIKKLLSDKKGMTAQNIAPYLPIGFKEGVNGEEIEWDRRRLHGRPYIFKSEEWLTPEELTETQATDNGATEQKLPF